MRLIHVVPAISKEASGPSYSVSRLCECLAEKQHDVDLAAMRFGILENGPAILKTFPLGVGPKRLGRSPAMAQWMKSECRSGRVDVVHNHGMWQFNALYPSSAVLRTKTKLVCSPRGAFSTWAMNHGSRAKKLFWPLLQKPALLRAHCFHATSLDEYKNIRRLGFKQPIAIIPNGVDVSNLQPFYRHENNKVRTLLFLSRIHKVKGVENLLVAWRAVHKRFPQWELKIVGGDDGYYGEHGYLDYLKHRSVELGLENVKFIGPVYGEEKQAIYHSADLFVLPTFSENFGMVVAESLAHGTPAIVTRGAPWSQLEKKRAGWWIDIGVAPLVACLEDALTRHPAQLAEMGREGRSWMEQEFSWESIATRMGETYTWLCRNSGAAPPWVRLD